MNDNISLKNIIDHTNLLDVYLDASEIIKKPGFDPKFSKQELASQFRHEAKSTVELIGTNDETGEEKKILRVIVETGARFLDIEATNPEHQDEIHDLVKLEIIATWNAEYIFDDDGEISADEINEFAKKNAGFHVWPYWREYLHSTCTRLHIPPVVLPMYTYSK